METRGWKLRATSGYRCFIWTTWYFKIVLYELGDFTSKSSRVPTSFEKSEHLAILETHPWNSSHLAGPSSCSGPFRQEMHVHHCPHYCLVLMVPQGECQCPLSLLSCSPPKLMENQEVNEIFTEPKSLQKQSLKTMDGSRRPQVYTHPPYIHLLS